MRISLRRSAVVGTTMLLAIGLSACSSGPSTADACASTDKALSSLTQDMQTVMMSAASNPDDTKAATAKVVDKFTALQKKVENEDVKKALDPMAAAYKTLNTEVAASTDGVSVMNAMEKFLTADKASGAEYSKVCAS
ncbi:hypothetical protein [Mycetocola saprophilus]|uniref:hypothetical protein n=1 Tax=Mycetocola saprophilus TaxID=76636 RepID=UPI0004C1AE10|nr:hypothetical protein [Mycetocola saprophilus]